MKEEESALFDFDQIVRDYLARSCKENVAASFEPLWRLVDWCCNPSSTECDFPKSDFGEVVGTKPRPTDLGKVKQAVQNWAIGATPLGAVPAEQLKSLPLSQIEQALEATHDAFRRALNSISEIAGPGSEIIRRNAGRHFAEITIGKEPVHSAMNALFLLCEEACFEDECRVARRRLTSPNPQRHRYPSPPLLAALTDLFRSAGAFSLLKRLRQDGCESSQEETVLPGEFRVIGSEILS